MYGGIMDNIDTVMKIINDNQEGKNAKQLAQKYNLSELETRYILNKYQIKRKLEVEVNDNNEFGLCKKNGEPLMEEKVSSVIEDQSVNRNCFNFDKILKPLPQITFLDSWTSWTDFVSISQQNDFSIGVNIDDKVKGIIPKKNQATQTMESVQKNKILKKDQATQTDKIISKSMSKHTFVKLANPIPDIRNILTSDDFIIRDNNDIELPIEYHLKRDINYI